MLQITLGLFNKRISYLCLHLPLWPLASLPSAFLGTFDHIIQDIPPAIHVTQVHIQDFGIRLATRLDVISGTQEKKQATGRSKKEIMWRSRRSSQAADSKTCSDLQLVTVAQPYSCEQASPRPRSTSYTPSPRRYSSVSASSCLDRVAFALFYSRTLSSISTSDPGG